jgi:TPR repeat protein
VSTSTEALEGGRLSSTEIVALVTRGDEVLSTGDITSARLFYERAANGGDALSALRLGATYDPTFLGRAGIRGISGDLDRASLWYLRARELDAAALRPLLKSVEPKRREEPAGTH